LRDSSLTGKALVDNFGLRFFEEFADIFAEIPLKLLSQLMKEMGTVMNRASESTCPLSHKFSGDAQTFYGDFSRSTQTSGNIILRLMPSTLRVSSLSQRRYRILPLRPG
jgi:hypothetical protein